MSFSCRISKLLSFETIYGLTARAESRRSRSRMCLSGEWTAEHRIPALGLRTCCFVFNDIPVLDQNPILHDKNVGRNPTGWSAETGKATVNHHEIALGDDHVVLVFQRVRKTLNESKESVASRSNVGTVLNVIRRPESFRRRVIALVEQGFERFQNDGLIFCCC